MFKFAVALSVVVSASAAFASGSKCTLSSDGTDIVQGVGRVSATTVTGVKFVCESTYNGSSIVSIVLSSQDGLVAKSSDIHSARVTTCVNNEGQPVVITCDCAMPEVLGM